MKVTGTATLHAPVERVWAALNDPAVLQRTIPGCQRLDELGGDRYRMTVTAGVASIKGTYTGEVALTDREPPHSFVLRASGSGAPGTVRADVSVRLAEDPEGTRLDYSADAVVGGPVGGVGQRVLSGVARRTAGEFFAAVDRVLTSTDAGPTHVPSARHAAEDGVLPDVRPAPVAAHALPPDGGRQFLAGALVGAGAALLGALVGGFVARRR